MQVLENTQTPKTECLIRILDVLMLYCMGHLAALIRYSSTIDDLAQIHQTTLYFCTALSPAIFSQFDLYQAWRGKTISHQFILTASAIFAVLATGLILSFLIRGVMTLIGGVMTPPSCSCDSILGALLNCMPGAIAVQPDKKLIHPQAKLLVIHKRSVLCCRIHDLLVG